VIGKFVEPTRDSETEAENAFRHALEINPRLPVAHKFYANLEADIGQSQRAVVRLLTQAHRHGNDPELFAGLVHACRYCGLYAESIAAHAEARRLDPHVPTSLEQTLLMAGDIERLLAGDTRPVGGGGDEGIRVIAFGLAGRRDEARKLLSEMRETQRIPLFEVWIDYLMAWLERSPNRPELSGRDGLKIYDDPEAIFQEGWLLCDLGDYEKGLEYLGRAVGKGYFVVETLVHSRQFDALRADLLFQTLLADAEAGRQQALAAFREAGGEQLLGRGIS
jgi:tetratricopeptide (TPR) repeat protein